METGGFRPARRPLAAPALYRRWPYGYLSGRPVMTRTYDQNDEAATRKVLVRQFDHNIREVYASYAQRDISSASTQVERHLDAP